MELRQSVPCGAPNAAQHWHIIRSKTDCQELNILTADAFLYYKMTRVTLSVIHKQIQSPTFTLLARLYIPACTIEKPVMSTQASDLLFSQLSTKRLRLHSRYSRWCLTSASCSLPLLGKELTFPISIDGRNGLCLHFLAFRFCVSLAPARPQLSRYQMFSPAS